MLHGGEFSQVWELKVCWVTGNQNSPPLVSWWDWKLQGVISHQSKNIPEFDAADVPQGSGVCVLVTWLPPYWPWRVTAAAPSRDPGNLLLANSMSMDDVPLLLL